MAFKHHLTFVKGSTCIFRLNVVKQSQGNGAPSHTSPPLQILVCLTLRSKIHNPSIINMYISLFQTKSETNTTPTRSRNLRRSQDTNQKRKTPSTLNKTVACDVEDSTNIENEIQEIVNLHNSRLAAKKAKK